MSKNHSKSKSNRNRVAIQPPALALPGWVIALALTLFSALAAVGKLLNQFRFMIYPDSYYYLLIAENLRAHLHPAGRLGVGGMPFPPPGYAAMKLTFPLLVSGVMATGVSSEAAGHAVPAVAGVLCVPLAYLAVSRWFDSKAAGLVAALLIATSYGITYWGGFVMSDVVSVALAFAALALVAANRPDRFGQPVDLLVGVTLFALLLSRPTYVVAVPMIAYAAYRCWEWGWRRALTVGAVVASLLAVFWTFWFPPLGFSGKILLRLAPVLAAALALGAFAIWLLRSRRSVVRGSAHPRSAVWAALAASVLLLLLAVQLLQSPLGDSGVFPALARFARRDAATLLLLVPGAYILARAGKGIRAGAMLAASLVLLAVYYWADPKESRYLIHVLPFLVPLASGVGLYLAEQAAKLRAPSQDRREVPLVKTLVVVVAFLLVISTQAFRTLQPASAEFLNKAYPREVSAAVGPVVDTDAILVTALPWPYYYHLRTQTWAMAVVESPRFFDFVPADTKVTVLEDASLRYHYSDLAAALPSSGARLGGSFTVPAQYQYGYSAIQDDAPVKVWSMTAGELKDLDSEFASGKKLN